MIEDEVVREVRAAREAFAASHGYDIRAMIAALRDHVATKGLEVVRLSRRPPIKTDPLAAMSAQIEVSEGSSCANPATTGS